MYPDEKRSIDLSLGLEGRFTIEKFRGDVCTYAGAETKNLFLINALNQMASNTSLASGMDINGVIFGAGNSEPAEGQAGLDSRIGTSGAYTLVSSDKVINTDARPPYVEVTSVFQSIEGAVVGNIAELALVNGTGAVPTRILTRALVKDSSGNPTVVPTLSDEFVRVTYKRRYYGIWGLTGELIVNTPTGPLTFDYEVRAVAMNGDYAWGKQREFPSGRLAVGAGSGNYEQGIGCCVSAASTFTAVDANVKMSSTASNRFIVKSTDPYVAGSKRSRQVLQLPLLNGNIASPGIRSLIIGHGDVANAYSLQMVHQVLLSGAFEKLSSQVLELPVVTVLGNV